MVSSLDHLCLHVMTPIATSDIFQTLKTFRNENGELTDCDEKKYKMLLIMTDWEILQAADVMEQVIPG